MQTITTLSNSDLLTKTRALVSEERRLTALVLNHLQEVERRRLHLELGFSSLFDFCQRELGYSENEAHSRISAMRLSREIPSVVSAVEEGRLSLTNLVRAQSYFRQEKKAGKPVSLAEKKELVSALEGKSTRDCERILAELSPQPVHMERERMISGGQTQITFVADEELRADLEKIRALWGHQELSFAEMIQKMAKMVLQKVDPQHTRLEQSPCARKVEVPAEFITPKNRHIPAAVRREVWVRDEGKCSYTHPASGRKCTSPFALELDHLDPYAYGGAHSVENLRLLCRAHHGHRTKPTSLEVSPEYRRDNSSPSTHAHHALRGWRDPANGIRRA
jgi:5-methylcytosine-specific restriction endonuclease McrA